MTVPHDPVTGLDDLGVRAFTTIREAGTFGLSGADPVSEVMGRWSDVEREIAGEATALVLARQVHGTKILEHTGGWRGWLRTGEGDGHITSERGVALAVSIADCVPVFIAHPSGTIALLHSGWKGTAAGFVTRVAAAFSILGKAPSELRVHLGPAICGRCYEVSADVREQLTGQPANRAGQVDLRSLLAEQASAAGVKQISMSPWCTRHDNDRFFSHRAGDAQRQIAVMIRKL
ncbi:MAG: polyphenol oxidase family protein [Gemmatimonadaceae bacterium]